MKICIDPGHSGPVEPGACAAGFTEADLNLAIAQKLGHALSAAGHELLFTRTGDIDSDGLSFRAQMANNWGADIFVSLHCNAAVSDWACGVETYCYPDSIAGRDLAENVQFSLSTLGYTANRGVKEANFAVLRLTNMPAILIECGFITSEQDRNFLASEQGQAAIAAAIVSGCETYSL